MKNSVNLWQSRCSKIQTNSTRADEMIGVEVCMFMIMTEFVDYFRYITLYMQQELDLS